MLQASCRATTLREPLPNDLGAFAPRVSQGKPMLDTIRRRVVVGISLRGPFVACDRARPAFSPCAKQTKPNVRLAGAALPSAAAGESPPR